jgi:hypothetical protein
MMALGLLCRAVNCTHRTSLLDFRETKALTSSEPQILYVTAAVLRLIASTPGGTVTPP